MSPRNYPDARHPLDGLAKDFECSHPRSNRTFLTALMLEASLKQCEKYVRGVTLDVGCGKKPYEETYFSSAQQYIGMDYLTDRSSPDVIGSAMEIPLPDSAYDTVVCTEVLEHVPEPAKALGEMYRVLKPGGSMILSTPMYWPRHEVPYDYFRYPYDGLLELVKKTGFEITELFSRGRSYVFIGQVIQQVQPIRSETFSRLLNEFFLMCDMRLKNDLHTLGWTVVGRKPETREL